MVREIETGPARIAQPQHLALDRPHGHARLGGQVERGRAGAGREHDLGGADDLAVLEPQPGHAVAVGLDRCHARTAERAAGALEGDGERRHQAARIDRVVAGHVEREAHGGRERGLGAARLARPQPLDLEAELAPVREQVLERLGLVAVAGDDQRAGPLQARDPRPRRRRARRRTRERTRAAQAELGQRRVARRGLGDRREHARGDLPRAGVAGVEHDGAQAATGRAPRARQPDRTAACDGDVKRTRGHCWTFPPYAGTTRIRFDGRRPVAALSAQGCGLP